MGLSDGDVPEASQTDSRSKRGAASWPADGCAPYRCTVRGK